MFKKKIYNQIFYLKKKVLNIDRSICYFSFNRQLKCNFHRILTFTYMHNCNYNISFLIMHAFVFDWLIGNINVKQILISKFVFFTVINIKVLVTLHILTCQSLVMRLDYWLVSKCLTHHVYRQSLLPQNIL